MNWNCTGRNYQSTQDSAEDNNLIQTIAEEEVLRLTKFQSDELNNLIVYQSDSI